MVGIGAVVVVRRSERLAVMGHGESGGVEEGEDDVSAAEKEGRMDGDAQWERNG